MGITNIKIALRSFLKYRFYTTLNYISLLAGLFVAFVCIEYVRFEYSYDKFHADAKTTYRLTRTYRSQDYSIIDFDNSNDTAAAQMLRIEKLKNIPGVKDVTQFIISDDAEYIEYENKRFQTKEVLTTNTPASFTSQFTWEPIVGSLSDFSDGKNKVLLTAASAERFFGKALAVSPSVINKVITINNQNYTVAAVIANVPKNSHFNFSIALNKSLIDYWGARIYMNLKENIRPDQIARQINSNVSIISSRLTNDPLYKSHQLQAITDIHLKSNILYELKTPGNYYYIGMIVVFAFFIVIITLFNYSNFTLALKSQQSKSLGIKKAIGASSFNIMGQFILEGVLLAMFAIPPLALLIPLFVPYFNSLMGTAISNSLFVNVETGVLVITLALFLGLLSGLAPSLLLAGKSVLLLFKENLITNRFQHFSMRRYLVISQFSVVIIITCVSYFIIEQLRYIKNKDLGFEKNGIAFVYTSEQNQDIFQQQLRQVPEVKRVGNGSSFGVNPYNTVTYRVANDKQIYDNATQFYLDYEALKAYQIKIIYGSVEDWGDRRVTLINRTAAEQIANSKNITINDVIGTTIITEPEYTAPDGRVGIPFEVAGIIQDINIFSLREKVKPYFITVSPRVRLDGRSIVAFDPVNQTKVLAAIKQIHKGISNQEDTEVEFVDDSLSRLYTQDTQVAGLLLCMNIMAIILTLLGVTGITVFLLTARKKEIGIKRVLGASKNVVIRSAIQEYAVFIGMAFLISCPIAITGAYKWLSNFAYRIEIRPFVFVVIGFVTFICTALLVAAITLKTINNNPVKSLRTE